MLSRAKSRSGTVGQRLSRLLTPTGRKTSSKHPPQDSSVSSTPAKSSRGRMTEEVNQTSPTMQAQHQCNGEDMDDQDQPAIAQKPTDDSSENVKVVVRIRPPNDMEKNAGYVEFATRQGTGVLTREPDNGKAPGKTQKFPFDHVLGESSTQEDVFAVAGQPVVENCISGYNASVFCYGQTGSGKTYTMQGKALTSKTTSHESTSEKGLMSRVFEHVFMRIAEEEDRKGRDNLHYSIRCSFLEIYNENITDLLNPSSTNLHIRDNMRHGCYVDGLTEHMILNVSDMLILLKKGINNRRVGETNMNRESSRSHSVLTCIIESKTKTVTGMTVSKFSRLNLIDLAGSERQKDSGVAGEHLKEASNINKSLTSLGRVINLLVEQQRSVNRSSVHVPYRDSKLTYLLQDSLGGNAKTFMIANVSPSWNCHSETTSTLRFASNAKNIVNKAVVNEEAAGGIAELQGVIQQLRKELEMFHSGEANPLLELKAQLCNMEAAKTQVQDGLDKQHSENKQLQQQLASFHRQMADYDQERENQRTFQQRVSVFVLSDEELRAGVGKDAEALAATVEKKMSKLRETEVLLSVAQSGVEDLKKSLAEAQKREAEQHVATASLESEVSRLKGDCSQLQRENVEHASKLARVQEELGSAYEQVRRMNTLANDRLKEIYKYEKTLDAFQSVAKAQEADMLKEISRLEKEALARQQVITNILDAADCFRTPSAILTPYKTPSTAAKLQSAANYTPLSAYPGFPGRTADRISEAPVPLLESRHPLHGLKLVLDMETENEPPDSALRSPSLHQGKSPTPLSNPLRERNRNQHSHPNSLGHSMDKVSVNSSDDARSGFSVATLSTCNLMYSNPMPADGVDSPTLSSPVDDQRGKSHPREKGLRKSNYFGLIRASQVLRKKAKGVLEGSSGAHGGDVH